MQQKRDEDNTIAGNEPTGENQSPTDDQSGEEEDEQPWPKMPR